jgi:hypothetical protein
MSGNENDQKRNLFKSALHYIVARRAEGKKSGDARRLQHAGAGKVTGDSAIKLLPFFAGYATLTGLSDANVAQW